MSCHSEPPGRAVHWEVDSLDIRGRHDWRFVLQRHANRKKRGPYKGGHTLTGRRGGHALVQTGTETSA